MADNDKWLNPLTNRYMAIGSRKYKELQKERPDLFEVKVKFDKLPAKKKAPVMKSIAGLRGKISRQLRIINEKYGRYAELIPDAKIMIDAKRHLNRLGEVAQKFND